jgi:putative nucleotidyltransferase with HDIG domain
MLRPSVRRLLFYLVLLLVTTALALAALLIPFSAHPFSPALEAGQVASEDVLAPAAVVYTSQVLTDLKREEAAQAVAPVYTAPDTSIARQQLERLRSALAFISSVRADAYASPQQKLGDLAALDKVPLSQETASNILVLSDARWQAVQQEAIAVLEQVMRNAVRPDHLEDARSSVPSLVSLSLPEEQAAIVAQLAAPFIVPNSLYSETLTEAARQAARQSVAPIQRAFMSGETVIRYGQVLSAADLEALQMLGVARPQRSWQDLASTFALVLLVLGFMFLYLRRTPVLAQDMRGLAIISGLFLVFLFAARLIVAGRSVIPFIFPFATYSLIVAAMFGAELSLVTSLPLAIMATFGMSNALELTFYFIVTSLFGVLILGKARRVTSFFWAGGAIAISGVLVIVVYRLPLPATDWVEMATLTGAALFNGLAAASLAIVLQFFIAQLLGVATPMQLMELTRPDHPLLQRILHDAPGTYQHSLQVANLAEQAAEQVGADPLLTRVGALYHDAGKAVNPFYFIENQMPGFQNPHDNLDPVSSAKIIIHHVADGLNLAREYHIPHRLMDFIAEHHGTMIARYQFVKAVAAAGGDESRVEQDQFSYPGPRPSSRETAILMLADGSEARVRAERPQDDEALRALIKSVIDNRVAANQLDNTGLTLRDLGVILNSFTATLRGIYHPRLQYPSMEAATGREITVPASKVVGPRVDSEAPLNSSVDAHSAVPREG